MTPPRMECDRTFAEFFAGIGLIRLALERLGWRAAFANDVDLRKSAIYAANFGSRDFSLSNIHDLAAEQIPFFSLATASFPCTDVSVAGRRDGLRGVQSGAFWGFARLLRELGHRRPKLVLIENVPGLLSSNGGRDLRDALFALQDVGYALDAFMVGAAHFVPQSRMRLFVVGSQGIRPRALGPVIESSCRPPLLVRFIAANGDLRWQFRSLPEPPERRIQIRDILEKLPPDDARWWSPERTARFMAQTSPRHRTLLESLLRSKRTSYATAFRRTRNGRCRYEIRNDGIAGCLRTTRGGSSRQILVKAGRGFIRVRFLTPRECARLQGVPDDFDLGGSPSQALFALGDAVCVPVIKWVAKNVLEPMIAEMAPKPPRL